MNESSHEETNGRVRLSGKSIFLDYTHMYVYIERCTIWKNNELRL